MIIVAELGQKNHCCIMSITHCLKPRS